MQGTLKIWRPVIAIPMCVPPSLPTLMCLICLQTPMGQWLHLRARYLHLLLEMKGLTKAPQCSNCSNAMEIKCSDCMGGNYFCKACCIQSHSRTPFHRMARWTGSHFAPVSLYSLGFVPPLGHHGDPCPLTVEVRSRPSVLCALTDHIFRVLKLLMVGKPTIRSLSALMTHLPTQLVRRGLDHRKGRQIRHRYPWWMGRACKDTAMLYLRPCLMSPPEAPIECAQQGQAIH